MTIDTISGGGGSRSVMPSNSPLSQLSPPRPVPLAMTTTTTTATANRATMGTPGDDTQIIPLHRGDNEDSLFFPPPSFPPPSPPPLLKRRTISCDDREVSRHTPRQRQRHQRLGGDDDGDTAATAGRSIDEVSDASEIQRIATERISDREGSAADGNYGAMDDAEVTAGPRDMEGNSDREGSASSAGDDDDRMEEIQRQALFSTPVRIRGGRQRQQQQQQQRSPSQLSHPRQNARPATTVSNLNRARAVSSDVVLNISSDCLPRYDNDLASRIDSISDHAVDVVGFATPERPLDRPSPNRMRANTCPHRPQRHSIFHRLGDEESGRLDDESDSDLESPPEVDSERSSSFMISFTPGRRSMLSPQESASDMTALRSPERRSYSASSSRQTQPSAVLPTFSPNNDNATSPLFTSPSSSARRTASSLRHPPSSSVSVSSVSSSATQNATTPNTQQTINNNNNNRQSSSGPSTSIPAISIQPPSSRNYIHRIHPTLMKFLMILSLYMLLAYTWNTDLQFRYKSMEINYGLSEYWNGGIGSHIGAAEKIGRNVPGKLFNDDGDDGGIAGLIRGLDDGLANSEDSASGDVPPSLHSLLAATGNNHMKKRPPPLSHARSSLSLAHPAYTTYNQRRRASVTNTFAMRKHHAAGSDKKWTWSRMAWCLVWMAFMLPIVEASIREVRRQVNFRFWNVRRLRSLRAMPNGNRVRNVHSL